MSDSALGWRAALLIGAGLLLSQSANAQSVCPERVDPGVVQERLSQLRPSISSGSDEVGERLDALEALATGCVDGPLFSGDLASLFLAQGVWEFRRTDGDLERGRTRMEWAAALGGEAVWSNEYSDLRDLFNEALAVGGLEGTVDIQIYPSPDVLVLDGQVEYEAGQRTLKAGAHLVQWLVDGGWSGRLVVVAPGGSESLRVGSPEAAEEPEEAQVSISAGRGRPERAEVSERWAGAALFLQRYSAQLSDGSQVWQGAALAPGGRIEARYEPLEWLSVGGDAAIAPAGAENPQLLTRLTAEAGVGWGDFLRGELHLGLALGMRPEPSPADGPPTFEAALAPGPLVGLRGVVGDPWRVEIGASGALLGPAMALSGHLTASYPLDAIAPLLRVDAGQLSQPGMDGIEDIYRWVGAEVGARWLY